MRALFWCLLAAACASSPREQNTVSDSSLDGWRNWARTVDWTDPEACAGHPGLPDTPQLLTWVKAIDGRWLTIAVDKRYDDRALRVGSSLPILGDRIYKGDAIVQAVLEDGRILRAWHHNPVPGVEVEVGDATWTRPVQGWDAGRPPRPSRSCWPSITVPALKGQVVTVDGRSVDIRITVNPTRAPMRQGYSFAIYFDRTYKGDATVQELLGPGLVRARVFNPVAGTTIRIGDTAVTHVPVKL